MIIITTIVMSMIIIMIMTIIVICSPSPLLMRPHRTAGILKALVLNPGANRPRRPEWGKLSTRTGIMGKPHVAVAKRFSGSRAERANE